MSILESIGAAGAKAIIERLMPQRRGDISRDVSRSIEQAVTDHLRDISNWSAKVHSLDAASAEELDSSTIEIGFDTEPRRFRGKRHESEVWGEAELLIGDQHYVVLGNPGSGKTTAVKRIIRRLLLEAPLVNTDTYQYPLLIRLREMPKGQSIHCALASLLGLEYQSVEVKRELPGGAVITQVEHRIAGEHIERVISRVLSSSEPIVLLDGLDEVWSETRDELAEEMSRLARSVRGSKVIVTSRTGENISLLEGFQALQLCPLSVEQIQEIALRWLSDPAPFMAALAKLPYRDIADRPLLLTQLLLLYRRYGFLPEQPAHVYKRVIRILLEEWDANRNVIRKSKYAGFDPDRKSEFLSAVAYHITYTLATTQFTEDQLVSAYRRVADVFNLPREDALQVARELEAHTGIIVKSGHSVYEFSHLSIQEYLCASYLVRSASPLLIRRALAERSAPVAVAVALSSQPAEWLSRLVLAPGKEGWLNHAGVPRFLTRLVAERPFFETCEPLGWAAMQLFFRLSRSERQLPRVAFDFGEMPGVMRSVGASLRWYVIVSGLQEPSDLIFLRARPGLAKSYEVAAPPEGVIPTAIIRQLAAESPDTEVWISLGRDEHRTTLGALRLPS